MLNQVQYDQHACHSALDAESNPSEVIPCLTQNLSEIFTKLLFYNIFKGKL